MIYINDGANSNANTWIDTYIGAFIFHWCVFNCNPCHRSAYNSNSLNNIYYIDI